MTTTRLIALCSPAMGSGKTTISEHLVARHGFVRRAFAGPLKRMTEALFTDLGVHPVDVQRYVYGDLKEAVVPGLNRCGLWQRVPLLALTLIEQTGASSIEARRLWDGGAGDEVIPVIGMAAADLYDALHDFIASVVRGDEITSRQWQQWLGTEFGRHRIRDSLWTDIAMAEVGVLRAAGKSVAIDDMRFPNEYAAVQAAGGETWRVVRPGQQVTSQHVSEGQLDALSMPGIFNDGTVADLHHLIDAWLR